MQLKYIILTAAFSVAATGIFAQNIPILTQTAPVGTVAPAPSFSETVGATDLNVIKTFVPILPTTDATTINENSPANAVKQQVAYMDGTNQVYQSISKNVATVGGQAKHLVQVNYVGTEKDQFSFLPYGTGDAAFQVNALAKQAAYYNNLYSGEGYTSFAQSVNTSSLNSRSSASYAPGKSQVGQSRATTTNAITNAADEIRTWDVDASGVPVSTG